MSVKTIFVLSSVIAILLILSLSFISPYFLIAFIVVGPITGVGVVDTLQKRQTIRRNFPVIGNFRYLRGGSA
ncbi:MAG: hypothetical protein R2682_04985 [Pyrinomonadaceae bacterium]